MNEEASYSTEWILSREDKFRYQLLGRMQMDCRYALGNGQIYGNHFWAGNEEDQIVCMKALWNSFSPSDKPEWLTMEQIENYDKEMQKVKRNKKWEGEPICISRSLSKE